MCIRDSRKGELSQEEYDAFLAETIDEWIKWQEEVGFDVLVHGEFERNDMVEYFGQNLSGYLFSKNGWVQSYGMRGVKPPIIWGDVTRLNPITVKWSSYAPVSYTHLKSFSSVIASWKAPFFCKAIRQR